MKHHALPPFLAVTALLCACAGDDAAPPVVGQQTPRDASSGGIIPDASSSTVDASTFVPIPVAPPRGDCVPGAYAGKFDCTVDGLPIWGGDLAFDLLEGTEGAGEFTSLVVRPGTTITGSDGYTGKFDGELAGTFDCLTGTFNGMLVRAVYLFPGAMYPVAMTGDLAGAYAPGTPPRLAGTMGPLTSPEWGAIAASATCTWRTERLGDPSSEGPGGLDGGVVDESTICPTNFSCVTGALGESVCRDATSQAYPPCDASMSRCTVGERQGICRPGLTGGECTITCEP